MARKLRACSQRRLTIKRSFSFPYLYSLSSLRSPQFSRGSTPSLPISQKNDARILFDRVLLDEEDEKHHKEVTLNIVEFNLVGT